MVACMAVKPEAIKFRCVSGDIHKNSRVAVVLMPVRQAKRKV